ncbi:transcriptional regulator NrdR [Candidatus Woesearchaeota archaeon]|nr:transcriptional regulator NrdR [Candidatus Woesearchaeota archaeon]
MRCPFCNHEETKVTDKRETGFGTTTRRRRECLKCRKRFTTYERIELINIRVIKKDGSREQFSREKIKNGIVRACEKRPISIDKIEKIVDFVEAEIRGENQKEISTAAIGNMVMKRLKKLDEVAYIRFASVYRSFADVDSFKEELKTLSKRGRKKCLRA